MAQTRWSVLPPENPLEYCDYNVYESSPTYRFGRYSGAAEEVFGFKQMRELGFESHARIINGPEEIYPDQKSCRLKPEWLKSGRYADPVGLDDPALIMNVNRHGPTALLETALHLSEHGATAYAANERSGDGRHAVRELSRRRLHGSAPVCLSYFYLTDANLRRWQGYFDEMQGMAGNDEHTQRNLNRLRRSLNFATLGKWPSLRQSYSGYFKDYRVIKARIGSVSRLRAGAVADYRLRSPKTTRVRPITVQKVARMWLVWC